MNQPSTSPWLRVCTLGFSLFVASTTLATPPHPTAQDLYIEGVQLVEQKRLLEARETLLRIDLAQLDRSVRQQVTRLFEQIDGELNAMPEMELRLAKADLALGNEDYRTAASHLETVAQSDRSSAEEKVQAKKALADVRAAQERLRPEIPVLLQTSIQAFDSGNYGEAKSGLMKVYNSGVALDLDQQADLRRYLGQIASLEAARGRFETPAVNVSVMQDPQEQPPPAEAEPEPQPEAEEEQPAEEEPTPTVAEDDGVNGDLMFQANMAEAREYLRLAREAQAEARWSAAAAFYQRVLDIDPDNAEARDGIAYVQSQMNTQPLLEPTIQDRAVRAQALRAEFENLIQQADVELAEGDFAQALDYVSTARNRLSEGRRDLSDAEYQELRQQALNKAQQIEDARRATEAAEIEREGQEAELQELRAQQAMEAQRDRQIAESLIAIRRLQTAQRYEEALLETENLLFMDPGNPAGLLIKSTLQDLLILRRYDELQREQALRVANNANELLEQSLVPRGIMEYPEDWPSLTLRRSNEFSFSDTEADRQVWSALAHQRAAVEFVDQPFGSVVDWIAQVANVNVDVHWKDLEQNFIDANTPINLKLNDKVNLQTVLDRVLSQLGADADTRPQYAVQNGILTISTRERLQENPIHHVYDIRDLLVDVPDFDHGTSFDLDAILDRSVDRENKLAGRILGESDAEDYDRGRDSREELVEKIRDVITRTIDPNSWQINGGETGSIQELNGNLIITTTARNHQDVSNLLAKLREIRSIQINVESRFLVVNEDFFEQIGVDLDVYYGGDAFDRAAANDPNLLPSDLFVNPQSGNRTLTFQRDFTSPFMSEETGTDDAGNREIIRLEAPPIAQAGRDRWSPWSLQQNTLGIASDIFGAPADSVASSILGGDPGASFGITFYDEIQVDLLIQATQADRRNVQLTSPKLTFFNGQRAFVQVTTSQFFVSDLQPVVGDASAGFDPTLAPVNEGVVLDVEGTVSADRRYVTMTVLASLADIIDIIQTPVPIVVGGRVVGDDPDDNDILTNEAFLESPIIQVSRVNTTVNVPDRGTIMLGGQTIRNDIQVETGVPVLSKIPVINRFFTNRVDTVIERTLVIMLKPTIIIQAEQENLLYPGLQDQIRSAGGRLGAF